MPGPDALDPTVPPETADVTSLEAVLGYGQEVAETSAAISVLQSSSSLVGELGFVDISSDVPLLSLDLRFMERAGLYCERAPPAELRELGISADAAVSILSAKVVDAQGSAVRTLTFEFKPHGSHAYLALWDGRDDAGFFVRAGAYHAALRVAVEGFYWDAISTELQVQGQPYSVSIEFRPKDDEMLLAAFRAADPAQRVGINEPGFRIKRDCRLTVRRGGVSVMTEGGMDAHQEAVRWGYFSTPKRAYFGCYVRHGDVSSIRLGDLREGQQEDFYISFASTPLIDLNEVQPIDWTRDHPQEFKDLVEIHPSPDSPFTGADTSWGCPVIPYSKRPMPYGEGLIDCPFRPSAKPPPPPPPPKIHLSYISQPFAPLRNRQSAPSSYLADNAGDFLSCVFGGFTMKEIQKKLKLRVELHAPVEGSLYERLHRSPAAFYDTGVGWLFDTEGRAIELRLETKLRIANGVLRRVRDQSEEGEDLVVAVDPNSLKLTPSVRCADGTTLPLNSASGVLAGQGFDRRYSLGASPEATPELASEGAVLVIEVRFAWLTHGTNACPIGWHPDLVRPDFSPTYLPALDDKGRRWDPGSEAFEFAIPSTA